MKDLSPINIDTKKYEHLNPGNTSVVKVYWRDHADSLEDHPIVARAVSTGFLIEDGEEYVVLAGTWDPIDGWSNWTTLLQGENNIDNIVGADVD